MTSSAVKPGAAWTATTLARPAVSVPVLSTTRARTRAIVSSALPPLNLGATGGTGRVLVEELHSGGHRVRAVSRRTLRCAPSSLRFPRSESLLDLACASRDSSPLGRLGLGNLDHPGVACASGRDRAQPAAGRFRTGYRGRAVDERGAHLRRGARGCHRGPDVCGRSVSGNRRRRTRAAQHDDAACARAADHRAASRRQAGGDRHRSGRGRGPPAGLSGRRGPGRRDRCRRYRVLDQSAGGAAHPGFAGLTLQRN